MTGATVPVLVFGSGLTALGVIRALGRHGIPALHACRPEGTITASRWYRQAPGAAPDGPSAAGLRSYLEGVPLDRAVVIACNDAWVQCLAGRDPDLRDRFPAALPDAQVIAALVDKVGLARSLQAAGTPHPRTVVLAREADLDGVTDADLLASFLKPADSQAFGPRFEAKAFSITSREDARTKLRAAQSFGLDMLLQEWIPGPSSNHYFVDGFIDARGTVTAMFARRRYRMYPADYGNSSFMASVPLREVQGAADALEQLLGHQRYRGIFSAEFKLDPRDGLFKLLEVNVRPWWYVEFAARCGVDVCHMYYRDALGGTPPPVRAYRAGARLIHTWCDFKAWGQRRNRGWRDWWDHWTPWVGSHRATFAWDDPLPAVLGVVQTVRRRARALLPSGDR